MTTSASQAGMTRTGDGHSAGHAPARASAGHLARSPGLSTARGPIAPGLVPASRRCRDPVDLAGAGGLIACPTEAALTRVLLPALVSLLLSVVLLALFLR